MLFFLVLDPLSSNLNKEGVALPVFYIPKFNAYYEGDWKMGVSKWKR
jgi:hypothetical protein